LVVVKSEYSMIVSDNKEFFKFESLLDMCILKDFRRNLCQHILKLFIPLLQDHTYKMVTYKLGSVSFFIIQSLSI